MKNLLYTISIGWSVGMLCSGLIIYIVDPKTLIETLVIATCPALGMLIAGIFGVRYG